MLKKTTLEGKTQEGDATHTHTHTHTYKIRQDKAEAKCGGAALVGQYW